MAQILLQVGSRPDIRLFKRHNGFDALRGIHYGIKGACDLHGFLQGGQAVEIEVKTGSGRLSPEQQAWRATCERFGVKYILARSVEDVTNALP